MVNSFSLCVPKYIENLIISGNTIFIPTFWPHSHFGPYFFILPYLIPKIKKCSHFGPYLCLTNGNSLRGKQSAPWVKPV